MTDGNWSPYTPPDLCSLPSGNWGLGAYAPAQSAYAGEFGGHVEGRPRRAGGPAAAGLRRTRWRVIRMCEGSFERRSASAGVLGKTAPAVAGHAYAWILDWEKQTGRG